MVSAGSSRPPPAESRPFRVIACRDIAQPHGQSSGGQRLLQLQLSDGVSTVEALERSPLPFLPRVGDELAVQNNAASVSGVMLLEPSVCALLARCCEAAARSPPKARTLSSSWTSGDVDESDPPPPFTQVSEDSSASAPAERAKPAASKPKPQPTVPPGGAAVPAAQPPAPRAGKSESASTPAAVNNRGGSAATPMGGEVSVPGLDPDLVKDLLAAGLSLEEVAAQAENF